ncbi:hypothetical protein FJTKL_06146 [Diaporthe vaccinii]|uniref:Uncharacterized protein n=1 Tax=Diaporthe vaccinii TaxID=105482 RepID=A0ABR4EXH7_9PEZI
MAGGLSLTRSPPGLEAAQPLPCGEDIPDAIELYARKPEALVGARQSPAGNYKPTGTPLVPQTFYQKTKYLEKDSVFAVKDDLVINFYLLSGNSNLKATFDLECGIRLAVVKS